MGIAGFRAIGRGEITTAKSTKDSPAYVYEKAAQISNAATERISESLPSTYVDVNVFDLPPHIVATGQGFEDDQLKNYNERVMNMISIANPGSIVIKNVIPKEFLNLLKIVENVMLLCKLFKRKLKRKTLIMVGAHHLLRGNTEYS